MNTNAYQYTGEDRQSVFLLTRIIKVIMIKKLKAIFYLNTFLMN